jgi:hypothetical protein
MNARVWFIPLFLSVILAPTAASAATEPDVCARANYGRGVGVPVSACRPDQEKSGALCYPTCREGYYGFMDRCWERCHEDYTDDGATCRRDAHTYGKEYYEQWNPFAGCPAGWTYLYPVCVHTDERCRPGYRDDGALCTRDVHIYGKSSYSRGAGEPMICANDTEYDAGLCYPRCNSGYRGVGPVCWEACRGDFYYDCGLEVCGDGQAACVLERSVHVKSCTEPQSAAPGCNGSLALCDRRYDEVAFAATHNSFAVLNAGIGQILAANHSENITASLRAGVRGLMLDTRRSVLDQQVHVCHNDCFLADYGTLASVLRSVRRFLDANPSETITIVLENYVSDMDIWQVVVDEGLESYVWENPFPGARNWPKLGELAKKVLIFNDAETKDPRTKIMAGWKQTFQNPYQYETTESLTGANACNYDRGSGPIFVMNHFTTRGLATPGLAPANNARSLIAAHAQQCAGMGRFPNFVFVDYWTSGDLRGGVQDVNGLERPIDPRPFLGKAFYPRSVAHESKGISANPQGTLYLSVNRGGWERWRFDDAGEGAFFLVNQHGAQLRSGPNGEVDVSPNRAAWERWRLRAAPGGGFVFTSVAHGRNLYSTPEGIFATSTVIGGWEPFNLEDVQLNWAGKSFLVSSNAHRTQLSALPQGELRVQPNQGGWERWMAEDAAGGAVYLRGANNLFLSSQGDGSTSLTSSRGANEKWRIRRMTTGQVVFTSVAHNRQLFATPEGPLATSTVIGGWEPFHLKAAPSPYAGKGVFLTNVARGTQLSVSPEGVLSQSLNRMGRETWTVEDVGDGTGAVYLRGAHGAGLSSDGGDGVRVAPNPLEWERWRLGRAASGETSIVSVARARYLSVTPEGVLTTVSEVSTTGSLGRAEEFRISDAPSNYVGKSFLITAMRHGGQIAALPQGTVMRSEARKGWETWTAEDAGNGEVFLRGAHGTVLKSDPNGNVELTTSRGPWERWRIHRTPDGNVVLTSVAHARHLGVTPAGVFYTGSNMLEWEQWILDMIP